MSEVNVPLSFSDAAAKRVKALIAEEENPSLMLRVYITGGGCSGFQYGFTFDETVNEGDTKIENSGVILVVDPMSLQYLIGGVVDYTEGSKAQDSSLTTPMQRPRVVAAHHLASNPEIFQENKASR